MSTQNGSTAVNRALSGAVVDSGLQVMQLCEIMPIVHNHHHSLKNPYIMREDREIVVKGDTIKYTIGCYDYLSRPLDDVNEIIIRSSEKSTVCALPYLFISSSFKRALLIIEQAILNMNRLFLEGEIFIMIAKEIK